MRILNRRLGLLALTAGLLASPALAQQQAQPGLSPEAQESTAAARVDEYLRCMSGCKDIFPGGELKESRVECVRGCRAAVAPLAPATTVPAQRER